jgi:hypothetical protein
MCVLLTGRAQVSRGPTLQQKGTEWRTQVNSTNSTTARERTMRASRQTRWRILPRLCRANVAAHCGIALYRVKFSVEILTIIGQEEVKLKWKKRREKIIQN